MSETYKQQLYNGNSDDDVITGNFETQRWNYRREQDKAQLNLLDTMERKMNDLCLDTNKNNSIKTGVAKLPDIHKKVNSVSSKSTVKSGNGDGKRKFLRRGGGVILKKNRWELEQQRKRERNNDGRNEAKKQKSKAQETREKLMKQWRQKQKYLDKQKVNSKKSNNGSSNTVKINPPVKPSLPANYKRPTKSAKFKQKHSGNSTQSNKDELKSNSFFESIDGSKSNDADVSVWNQAMPTSNMDDNKSNNNNSNNSINNNNNNNDSNNEEIYSNISSNNNSGFNSDSKGSRNDMPTFNNIKPNFARHNPRQQFRHKGYIAKYSHHYSSISQNISDNSIKNANHFYSKQKNLFNKQATVNTLSKRDRLAQKYIERQNNSEQINLKKSLIEKEKMLENEMKICKDKQIEFKKSKQQSLDEFKRYQTMIENFENEMNNKRKEFDKYKKKEEQKIFIKKQEIKKMERNINKIPNRQERNIINEYEMKMKDILSENSLKEQRYKAQIERLRKLNKQLKTDKKELSNQIKTLEKYRLASMKSNNNHNNRYDKENIGSNNNYNRRPMSSSVILHGNKNVKNKQYSKNINNRHLSMSVDVKRPLTMNTYVERYNYKNNSIGIVDDNEYKTDSDSNTENENNNNNSNNIIINNEYSTEYNDDDDSDDSPSWSNDDNNNKLNKNYLPNIPQEYRHDHMTYEQENSDVILLYNNPLSKMQHPDGRIENIYKDDSKLIIFPNGTKKYIFNNLYINNNEYLQIIVKFPNNDVKKILNDGTEVYYYCNNNIIHVTKKDGLQLFYFDNQQHEIHFPDNSKHILFKDGTKKYIDSNGKEQCVFIDE